MNKCCECANEEICKEHRGSHRYCFKPKEKTKAESIRIDMVKNMIVCYEKAHRSDSE